MTYLEGRALVQCWLLGGNESEPRCTVGDAEQPQNEDDSLSTADRAHGLRTHRMTDGDISLDRERRD